MTDIALSWDVDIGAGDLHLAGADLAPDDGLRTAVIVSLFTDRRAGAEDVEGGTARRGWWGDTLADDDRIGSLLWLLRREKQTAVVLVRAEGYAREALAWLVEDGIAVAVAVSAEWVAQGRLALDIAIDQRGAPVAEYRFELEAG